MTSPFSIMPIEAALDDRLTKMQLRVLIALLSFRAKNTDSVYPSREKLAGRCGYNVRTISKVTGQLQKLGWIEKEGKGGFSKSCTYKITVPDLDNVSRETVSEVDTVTELDTLDDYSPAKAHDTGLKTVTELDTVSKVDTVPEVGTKTVTEPGTKTVSGLVTRKEQTIEQTREQTSNNTTGGYFQMFSDWSPSENAFAKIRLRNIPKVFAEDSVPEFVLYWIDTPHKPASEGSWSQRFLKHCARQFEIFRANQNKPQSIPMSDEFYPSDENLACLTCDYNIPIDFIHGELDNFKRYWRERREESATWDTKFFNNVRHRWLQLQTDSNKMSFEDRISNRDWATQ